MTVKELRKTLRMLPDNLQVWVNLDREIDIINTFVVINADVIDLGKDNKACVILTEPGILNDLEKRMAKTGRDWLEHYKKS